MTHQGLLQIGLELHRQGRLAEADAAYRQILAMNPAEPDALHFTGVIASQMGRQDVAADLIARSIAIQPKSAEAHSNLGRVLKALGRLAEATAVLRRAIELKPDLVEAHHLLGLTLQMQGALESSVVSFENALQIIPSHAQVWSDMGVSLMDLGRRDSAIKAFQRALALQPDLVDASNNLGIAYFNADDLENAERVLAKALSIRPDDADVLCNLGIVLKDQGRMEEAVGVIRRAMVIAPQSVKIHSNLLFSLIYLPTATSALIKQESMRWAEKFAKPCPDISPYINSPDPSRRLQIGYVSADFTLNVSGNFIIPLLSGHDPLQVKIICYSQVQQPDDGTRQMQALSHAWRTTVGWTDAQIARQVRADGIDILVDLKLHTRDNRLGVFAHKAAPVQATWLGYPGTTGMETVDYRLTDPYLDPPGQHDADYCEKSLRLPDTSWCYWPLCDLPVNALPAISNGYITFGCLNNFCKVSDRSLRLWAAAMQQIPGSKLLLLASPGKHRNRVANILAEKEISAERIEFVGRMPRLKYLRQFHRVDIALDTLPYNGHTTSLDGLWMGVPLVTRVGKTVVGRAGLSELSNLNMTQWCAHNDYDFISKVVLLAGDLNRLRLLRESLRSQMESSPLMDAKKFAQNMETAYRQMWNMWCQGQSFFR